MSILWIWCHRRSRFSNIKKIMKSDAKSCEMKKKKVIALAPQIKDCNLLPKAPHADTNTAQIVAATNTCFVWQKIKIVLALHQCVSSNLSAVVDPENLSPLFLLPLLVCCDPHQRFGHPPKINHHVCVKPQNGQIHKSFISWCRCSLIRRLNTGHSSYL